MFNDEKLCFLDRLLFVLVFITFLFDLPFLIKPINKLFRKRLLKKYPLNKELVKELRNMNYRGQ